MKYTEYSLSDLMSDKKENPEKFNAMIDDVGRRLKNIDVDANPVNNLRKLKNMSKQELSKANASEEIASHTGVIERDGKDGKKFKFTGPYTKSEVEKRKATPEKLLNKMDLDKREEIIAKGGEAPAAGIINPKLLAGAAGATAAGLGAYGLYKYLKNKKKKEN